METVFHVANEKPAELLIKNGVNIHQGDSNNITALHLAAMNSNQRN